MSAIVDYKRLRERGGELLDFWAASMRSRSDANPDHRGLFRDSVPSTISQQLKAMESGRSSRRVARPDDIDADAWQVLQVEGAFLSMAATAAESVYGKWSELDNDGRRGWDAYRNEARSRIRGLCFHVLVMGQRPGGYIAEDTRAHLALYGQTHNGYARWLAQRIDDVREFLGA